jgi:hypothetical protein
VAQVPPATAPPVSQAAPLPLRVCFLGERARAWLSGWVEPVPPGALEGDGEQALDALVLDPEPEVGRAEAERLCRRARDLGARVIGLGGGPSALAGLCDLTLGDGGAGVVPMAAVRPVDPRVINPLGFRHSDVAGFAALGGAGVSDIGAAGELLAEVARSEPVVLFTGSDPAPALPRGVVRLSAPEGGIESLQAQLKERLGVLDHPALHPSAEQRAGTLVALAAAGVPVVLSGHSDELRPLVGEELFAALRGVSPVELSDLERRERVSVSLRRAALRHHSLDARWRQLAAACGIEVPPRPKVSVILSTRREEWLSFGLSQVKRQSYQPRELVVCLHGDDFQAHVEERIRAEVEGPLEIVHVRSELTLGDALNAGVEVASGDYVTKMDDDDYYSVDHLWDLALALEYSGADLVGKAAEFVYLEEIDVTVRQLTRDVETRLAGGGMMLRKGPLKELGGWPSLSRGEDLAIVRRYEGNGHRIHRLSPHGYILNRHGRDHTWRPYVDYFLFRSGLQWRGLRFDQTGID